MVCVGFPILKQPCMLIKNPTCQVATLSTRPCCQGATYHVGQRAQKLGVSLVAGIISIAAISGTQEAMAQMLDSQKGGTVFQKACIGCHYEGGNVLQPGATLTTSDLERNGIATIDDIFNITYYGKGRMPGFGEKCTPKGQCTFGPRLSDEDIRLLADYVKTQADQGWPKHK